MSLTYWNKYLIDAGIPVKASSSYAATFVDNRISQDMIPDLSKSVLADLGITIVGDIIAILKHAIYITQQMSASKQMTKKSSKTEKQQKPEKSKAEKAKSEKQAVKKAKPVVNEKKAKPVVREVVREVPKILHSIQTQAAKSPAPVVGVKKQVTARKVRVTEQPASPEGSPTTTDTEEPAPKPPPPVLKKTSKKEVPVVRKVTAPNRPVSKQTDRQTHKQIDLPTVHVSKNIVHTKRSVGLVTSRPQRSISKLIKLRKNSTETDCRLKCNESDEQSDDTYDDSESDEQEEGEPMKRRVFGPQPPSCPVPPSTAPILTRITLNTPCVTRTVTQPSTQTVTCSPVTRVVRTNLQQTVRCVSPDSTTDTSFPNKPKQVATVILNTKGKCSVRPVSPPADLQVEKRRRTVMPRTDGKTTLTRVLQRHLADVAPKPPPPRKDKPPRLPFTNNSPDKRRITAEKFNSFRSDDEIRDKLQNNKFRSEDDQFEVVRAKIRRARSLSGGKLPRVVVRRNTPTVRVGSSHNLRSNLDQRCKTLRMSNKVMKLGGVASRLEMFNNNSSRERTRHSLPTTDTLRSRATDKEKSVFSRLGR